jgi:hypothetical protein
MTVKNFGVAFAVALGVPVLVTAAHAGMPAPRQLLPVRAMQTTALPAGATTSMPSGFDTPPAQDQDPDSNTPVLAFAGPGWG